MLCRALEIIQDEEYLDDVDFDEIKRQKRQTSFTEYQSEDKINPKTIETFQEALNLNEIVEIPKIQNNREKRQLMVNTTMNSLDDIFSALLGKVHTNMDLPYAVPKEIRQQFCDLVSAEFFRGTLKSTLQSNLSCSAAKVSFPATMTSVLSFQGYGL